MSKFQFVQGQDIEKGYLVGVNIYQEHPLLTVDDSLQELALLAKTAGIEVVGQASQNVKQINPATFVAVSKKQLLQTSAESIKLKSKGKLPVTSCNSALYLSCSKTTSGMVKISF